MFFPTYKHFAGKSSLGAKSITTKNLNVVASGTFALKDTIILQNLDATTAQNGKFPGSVSLEGDSSSASAQPLTVEGGKFTRTGDITIVAGAAGKLLIQNSTNADASSLTTCAGNYVLDRSQENGKLTVLGAHTLLDLSQANLKYQGGNTADPNVAIDVQAGGLFKAQGSDLGTILDPSSSGAVFSVDQDSTLKRGYRQLNHC